MKKLIIILMLFFPIMMNYETSTTHACSCVQPGTAIDELNQRDFVFSGKVKNIVDPKKGATIISSADPLQIHFEVNEVWKGIDETEVFVVTERDSASCGFEFIINDDYLVYGNIEDGQKHVSVCSKTTPLIDGTVDLDELGEGKLPTKVVTLEKDETYDESESNSQLEWLLLTFGAILILGSFIFILVVIRRKKA